VPGLPRRACRRAERASTPHPRPLQAGADALAALGVNSALFTFSFVVFNFLATATTPMVASSLALGDRQAAGKVTLQALGLASVLGAALAGGLLHGADGALALMGAGPETGRVHELATEFLTIRQAPFRRGRRGRGHVCACWRLKGCVGGFDGGGGGRPPRQACSRHAGKRLAAPGVLKESGGRGEVDGTGCAIGPAGQAPAPPFPRNACRALAAPAALLMTVGQGAFRGLQDMRTPLGITLAANAINLALDTVLILGLGWGVRGAATATTTAEWVAAAAYLGLLYRRRAELGGLDPRLLLGARLREAAAEMAPFLQAGSAMLMRTALLLGTKTLASATAARWPPPPAAPACLPPLPALLAARAAAQPGGGPCIGRAPAGRPLSSGQQWPHQRRTTPFPSPPPHRLGVVPIAAHQVVTQLWLLSSLIVDSVAIAGQTLVAVQARPRCAWLAAGEGGGATAPGLAPCRVSPCDFPAAAPSTACKAVPGRGALLRPAKDPPPPPHTHTLFSLMPTLSSPPPPPPACSWARAMWRRPAP
jgi:hypothetical protein